MSFKIRLLTYQNSASDMSNIIETAIAAVILCPIAIGKAVAKALGAWKHALLHAPLWLARNWEKRWELFLTQ